MFGFDLLPLPGSLVRTPDGTCHIVACMSSDKFVICLINDVGKYHTTGVHGIQRMSDTDAPHSLLELRAQLRAERATEAQDGSDT